MYFLTYRGQPKLDADDIKDIGGAYVNCYILKDDLDQADKIAREEIEKMSWEILTREEAYVIDKDSLPDDGRAYYEQALVEQTVYVFHTYPMDEDGD